MDTALVIDGCLDELDKLRGRISRGKTKQVSSQDERLLVKTLAVAWFRLHRESLLKVVDEASLEAADAIFKQLLEASDRYTTRERYKTLFKETRKYVTALRPILIGAESQGKRQQHTADSSPDFSPLVQDEGMKRILEARWAECAICVKSNVPLSAVVMMGGLLEGLLLARVQKETDKSKVFGASSAPKDKNQKVKPLNEWGLKNYIDVANELGWISVPIRDVGSVLRDYRNYVHPQKEYSHGISISPADSEMFWEIAKRIARSVIQS